MTKKVAFSQTALVAAIVMASPVQAASDYRKLYRGNDGPSRAFIETRKPYEAVKQCVLAKTYALKFGDKPVAAATDQEIAPIQNARGKGETYSWGKQNTTSIDFTQANGVTTVALFGQFNFALKDNAGNQQIPLELFRYFSACTDDNAPPGSPAGQPATAIYTLESKASARMMADCTFYAVDKNRGRDTSVTRKATGNYQADFTSSYKKTGETLFIQATSTGSKVSWNQATQTAFMVIKLDNPVKEFNRAWAEENHPIISELKKCADIADGKAPPIAKSPEAKTAKEVLDPIFDGFEARYKDGKIEMAEMPLEVISTYQISAGETLGKFASDYRPTMNAKFLAAAAIPLKKGAIKQNLGTAPAKSKTTETILPLIYMHQRTGLRTKGKADILRDVANHLYCDETDGIDFSRLVTISCYQDRDQNGAFETRRMAAVKIRNSAEHIYFVGEPMVIPPLPFRKLADAEIPTTIIYHNLNVQAKGIRTCSDYQGLVKNRIRGNFCYASLFPDKAASSANGVVNHTSPGLSVSVAGEISKDALVTSFTTYPVGTLIGKIDPREPVMPFGTEPLWINQILANRGRVALRGNHFKPQTVNGKIILTGSKGDLVATVDRVAAIQLQVDEIIDLGGGNPTGLEVGQKLAGLSFSLDPNPFEPPRLFACGTNKKIAAGTVCLVADRPYSSVSLKFVGDLRHIPQAFISADWGPAIKVKTASDPTTPMWSETVKFTGWFAGPAGEDVAYFAISPTVDGKSVAGFTKNIARDTGEIEIAGRFFRVKKLNGGGLVDGFELVEFTKPVKPN